MHVFLMILVAGGIVPAVVLGALSGVFCISPRKGIFQGSGGQDGLVQSLITQDFQAFPRRGACRPPSWVRSFCPAFAWHVSQGVPSETRGSTCPNPCLIVAFSNPLRPNETSALRQDAGWLWASQFSRTKPGGSMDRAGQVPWRDVLRTVDHD